MIKVKIPATSANLGPGFDSFGLALDWYNEVWLAEADVLKITAFGHGADRLPLDETNVVYRALVRLVQHLGKPMPPVQLRIVNHFPLERGLGSSAAAIVGGLVAANRFFGDTLTQLELLQLAMELEGHPDNVAPALMGGFTIALTDHSKPIVLRLTMPPLTVVLVIPDRPLETKAAREVLPSTYAREDVIFNLQRASLLVGAVATAQLNLLAIAAQDRLHQPYRAQLLPGMEDALQAGLEQGAYFTALSGSGSTLLALCDLKSGPVVAQTMVNRLAQHNVNSQWVETTSSLLGAHIVNP